MTSDAGPEAEWHELYAGAPAGFVARRDQLAKQARDAGDRALATRIKALRRPSVGAWYLNTASRAGLPSLAALLEFGAQLRSSQAAGDFAALRDLAPRRGVLTAEVVRDLTALMASDGTPVTPAGIEEVRSTLAAALADPQVADEVARGRVDRAHSYGGFGELLASAPPPAAPPADAPSPAAATGRGPAADEERVAQERRRRLEAAQAALDAAEAAHSSAGERRSEVESDARELADSVDMLERRLAGARHDLVVVQAELADARTDEAAAAAAVEEARRALAAASG